MVWLGVRWVWYVPRRLVCLIIRGYQKTWSPDHGVFKSLYKYEYCRFKPTCSEYCYDSVKKHGVIWGGLKGFWRILRCNPCSKGGYDPVE